MRSDVQFWTDVAVGQCVKKAVAPEEAVWYTLRCYLAQMLAYYRRDLPKEWADQIDESIPNQFSYDMANRMKGDVLFGVTTDIPEDEYRATLDDHDFSRTPALSNWGWQVVKETSGMSRQEWEQVAEHVQATLDKIVTCPKCNLSGKLADISVLVAAPDPFARVSATAPHFTCEWCGSDLTLDTSVKGLEMTDKRWPNTKGIVFWVSVVAFVSTFVGILWALKWK